MPYYYWWDPTYFLVIIGAVICLLASAHVNNTFKKYAKYRSMSGMTGAQAAQRILNAAGIYDVEIRHVSGNLTDHYDPRNKTLSLSDSVYGSASVAAVGVAAHECGHAIQHQKNYAPLTIRGAIVPVANIGSTLALAADSDWNIYQQPQWSGIDYSRNHLLFTGSIISDCNTSGRI